MLLKSRIYVILVAIIIIFTMIGCSTSQNIISDKKGVKGSTESKNLPQKLKNPDITILFNNEPDELCTESTKIFEEKYGGKVSTLMAGSNVNEQLITLYTAGDSPDITYWRLAHMPNFPIKNLIQPLDDYIDFSDPVWNLKAASQLKYKGKYYGVTRNIVTFFVYFNKTMFENNGLKTPLEYYKEGKWNWDTFREVAMKLTQDTNRDGTIDQWGYSGINPQAFIYSNGIDVVAYKDDGSVELTINDPKMIQALQFIQDGFYKDKYINPVTNAWREDFASGKVAMVSERFNTCLDNLKSMKYEWDIVAFPVGPEGDKDVLPAGSGNWGIPTGAKNPEGAVAWMYIYAKLYNEKAYDHVADVYSDEQIQRQIEFGKNIALNRYMGIGEMQKIVNQKVFNELKKGTPVHTVISSVSPALQNEIDVLMSGN